MAINIIDRNLDFASNHSNRKGAPKGIVLHHSDGTGSVEDVNACHRNHNGWAGIGYHFYIRKDGKVYRGRPEEWLGAHTSGYNDMIGVCAEGNFENDTMGTAQKAAVVETLKYLYGKYGKGIEVYGHRDLDATACPGKNYPFDEIVNASKNVQTTVKKNLVFEFQQAAIADSLPLNVYGADGVWGEETANAASMLVKKGSVGCRVKLIQTLLIEKGYNLREYGADAHFGDETDAAVKAYQNAHGLAVDGIVGVNTWKSLLGVAS